MAFLNLILKYGFNFPFQIPVSCNTLFKGLEVLYLFDHRKHKEVLL